MGGSLQARREIRAAPRSDTIPRQHLENLKDEIERNELLRKDLGPFEEREDEWNSSSIVLPLLGARITAASTETSVRGIRHGPHRPQLIICDDIEDLQSVKTRMAATRPMVG